MLALADRDGIVHCTAPGLADRARITLEQCRVALQTFLEPDQDSLTMADEGRRIRRVDDGWELINYEKYRHLLSVEDRREKTRLRVQSFRNKRAIVTPRNACNDIASTSPSPDTEADKVKNKPAHFVRPTLEEIEQYVSSRGGKISAEAFFDFYESVGWKIGNKTMKNWHSAVGTWEKRVEGKSHGKAAEFEAAIRRAVASTDSGGV
jgi:hypothetical protein